MFVGKLYNLYLFAELTTDCQKDYIVHLLPMVLKEHRHPASTLRKKKSLGVGKNVFSWRGTPCEFQVSLGNIFFSAATRTARGQFCGD